MRENVLVLLNRSLILLTKFVIELVNGPLGLGDGLLTFPSRLFVTSPYGLLLFYAPFFVSKGLSVPEKSQQGVRGSLGQTK